MKLFSMLSLTIQRRARRTAFTSVAAFRAEPAVRVTGICVEPIVLRPVHAGVIEPLHVAVACLETPETRAYRVSGTIVKLPPARILTRLNLP